MSDETDSGDSSAGPSWVVDSFTYLGSVLSADGALDKELTSRLAKASRAFGALQKPIFGCSDLSIKSKRLVYKAIVLPTLFYGAETWPHTHTRPHTHAHTHTHTTTTTTINQLPLGVTPPSTQRTEEGEGQWRKQNRKYSKMN